MQLRLSVYNLIDTVCPTYHKPVSPQHRHQHENNTALSPHQPRPTGKHARCTAIRLNPLHVRVVFKLSCCNQNAQAFCGLPCPQFRGKNMPTHCVCVCVSQSIVHHPTKDIRSLKAWVSPLQRFLMGTNLDSLTSMAAIQDPSTCKALLSHPRLRLVIERDMFETIWSEFSLQTRPSKTTNVEYTDVPKVSLEISPYASAQAQRNV
jgi:hypothetical protein